MTSNELETLDDLRPAPYNPRKISTESLDALGYSLASFGDISGIVWNARTGNLVCGHQRITALKKTYGESLHLDGNAIKANGSAWPIRIVDWPIEKERAANMAANASTIAGRFTPKAADILNQIKIETPDIFEGLLFSDLSSDIPAPSEPDLAESDPGPPPADPVSQAGDLWLLGDHRVLCGDATDEDSIRVLFGQVTPDAIITDPPYGVNYERSQSERGGNASVHAPYHEGDAVDVLRFMALWPGNVVVMTYPIDRHFDDLATVLKSSEYHFRKELVWAKESFSFWPGAKYQQQQEPIIIMTKADGKVGLNVPANQGTVFSINRPKSHDLHPTCKPIELFSLLVQYHTNEAVADPFLGSGTTLIAAEKLGRICYGMEIEPRYVDVIVRRWQNVTGKTGIRERNGRREEVRIEEV